MDEKSVINRSVIGISTVKEQTEIGKDTMSVLQHSTNLYAKYIKRCMDIILSVLALPFLLLLVVSIAPIVWLSDRGPVFYNAKRLGYKERVFKMYKFRSMKVNASDIRNADGSTINSENDPRQTKIGKFLRKTSIDELPQIINVLKGDMSFVGPRPDLPDAVEIYLGDEKLKLQVRPGITGYCQAYYRNTLDIHERFKLDVRYANEITMSLDLKIILKTFSTVILRKGVYRNDSVE